MTDANCLTLNEPPASTAASLPIGFRKIMVVGQVVGISAVFAGAVYAFAWARTGSTKFVWPWLCGDCVVFEPARIEFGQVPKSQMLERQIRVVNLSSKPLKLLGSQPSCLCISLDEFPIVVSAPANRIL